MTFKLMVTAVALTLTMAVSVQACEAHSEHTMSCAQGSVWDAETKTCVPQTSS